MGHKACQPCGSELEGELGIASDVLGEGGDEGGFGYGSDNCIDLHPVFENNRVGMLRMPY